MSRFLLLLAFVSYIATLEAAAQSDAPPRQSMLLDDFESYEVDGLPLGWQTNHYKDIVPMTEERVNDRERFIIGEENGNRYVRAIMHDQAHRLILSNGNQFSWRIDDYPYLRWDWRAIELPEGAREDKNDKNDTGAAIYVVFNKNWLGMPRIIKYTYSSSLPVGTTASYRQLKVLVVSSQIEEGMGQWLTIERNVKDDFRRFFGKDAPDEPLMIVVWSDSDTMDATAIADFDNLMLLGEPPGRP